MASAVQYRGMGVEDGAGLGAGAEDVAMKAPFGGGRERAFPGFVLGGERHGGDVLGAELIVGNGRGGDQHRAALADADIARGALVDAERVHPAAGLDDRPADQFYFRRSAGSAPVARSVAISSLVNPCSASTSVAWAAKAGGGRRVAPGVRENLIGVPRPR